MVKELVISIVSGIIVSILSAMFIDRGRGGSTTNQPQNMSMNAPSRGGGSGRIVLAFFLGVIVVFGLLFIFRSHGHSPFGHRW